VNQKEISPYYYLTTGGDTMERLEQFAKDVLEVVIDVVIETAITLIR